MAFGNQQLGNSRFKSAIDTVQHNRSKILQLSKLKMKGTQDSIQRYNQILLIQVDREKPARPSYVGHIWAYKSFGLVWKTPKASNQTQLAWLCQPEDFQGNFPMLRSWILRPNGRQGVHRGSIWSEKSLQQKIKERFNIIRFKPQVLRNEINKEIKLKVMINVDFVWTCARHSRRARSDALPKDEPRLQHGRCRQIATTASGEPLSRRQAKQQSG